MLRSSSLRVGAWCKPVMWASVLMLAVVACGYATEIRAASDTSRDRYEIDRTCEALATSGVVIPNRDPADVKTLADLFSRRLQASGPAAGQSPDEVARDLDRLRASIQARLNDPDPLRARTERADAVAMQEKCAALPVFEILGRAKHP